MAIVRQFGNNVAEQSSTIGTGTYELDGALSGYRTYDDEYDLNDRPYFAVRNSTETKYEYNKGTTTFTPGSPATLLRDVWLSSNSNNPVSWDSDDLPLTVYVPTSGELLEYFVRSWLDTARNELLSFGQWWKKDDPTSGSHSLKIYDGTSDVQIGVLDTSAHTFVLDAGVLPNVSNFTGTSYVQSFLGASVALNNTANYFNGPNTGSIGANGQVWQITIVATMVDTSAAAALEAAIHDGSAYLATSVATSPAANFNVSVTVTALVLLTAATTFTLRARDGNSVNGSLLTSGVIAAIANKSTSITAVRIK
jgi:hypothetical protein